MMVIIFYSRIVELDMIIKALSIPILLLFSTANVLVPIACVRGRDPVGSTHGAAKDETTTSVQRVKASTTTNSRRGRPQRFASTSERRERQKHSAENRRLQWQMQFQPKVTRVEQGASSRVAGSVSIPEGSTWCRGKPTYWLVGHQHPEHPWCREVCTSASIVKNG